ncbi:MAG: SH3 domain-containing protein [Clostridiales bacterium]|nr:SH3 domain-containing protein [Clostridiales bacterium]
MNCAWKRMLAGVMIVALVLSILPMMTEKASAESYGKTTATGVRLRKTPSTSAEYWFRLPIDYVCAYSSTTTDSSGVTWYKVNITDPESAGTTKYVGYLHGDYYRPLTDEEESAYGKTGSASSGTSAGATSVTGATGMVTNDEVNFRQSPSLKSPYLFKVNRGTVVGLLSIPSDTDLDPWYHVEYNGSTGYIQGPFIRVMSYGTIAPSGSSSSSSTAKTATYVTLILSSCHLRSTPGGAVWEDWEERGASLPVAGEPVSQGGYVWYPVIYKGRTVYVRGDCVSVTNGSGSSVSVPTESPPSVIAGYVQTTKAGVNLRLQPAGTVITQVGKNQTFPFYGTPRSESGYTWYYVDVDTVKGYLRSDCVKVVSTSSATDAPSGTATEAPSTYYGFVKTTVKKVNLRSAPGGSTQEQIADAGTILPVTGIPVVSGKYTWYPVRAASGRNGYLRSDCVTECDASGNTGSSPTPVPTPVSPSTTATPTAVPSSSATSGSLRTIKTDVALRTSASPDGTVKDRVPIGTILTFTNVTTGGGYTWYQVKYGGRNYYIRGDCITVVSSSESDSSPTAAPTSASDTILGYIKTTKSGVNVRSKPAGSNVLGRVDKGNVYAYYEKTSASGYSWYKVNTVYGTGYLRSDCVSEVNSDGGEIPAPTAVPGSTDVSTNQAEATYAILKVGSTGTGVRNLVQELINQGYYKGSVTSEYTTAVANAVKAFQSANGLTADGIAGEATQHKLFGTTAVGTQDYSNLSMVLYPAEKIDWFTGGIQELIPKGSNFKVYDVKTGIVWWAHRWSGGNHADIETLTASDTARLCKIYGVSKASQITESTHWQRRPSLITVGTRTFACALYGVPHNDDGDTIADNNMTGQICLHFTNSRTHGTNKVVSYNEEAIEYAWQYAPNGHK